MKKEFSLAIMGVIAVTAVMISACSVNPGDDVNRNSKDAPVYSLGALKEDPVKYQKKLITRSGISKKFYSVSASSLPVSVDYTYLMPPVKSQGGQGSCVGWATGYYAKTFQEGREELWDLSVEANQYSPAWVYNQINFGMDSGSFVSDALELLTRMGNDTWANFPYNQSDYLTKPDVLSYFRASHYKAFEYYSLPYDVDTLKSILVNSNVIVFRVDVYPDFDTIGDSNPVFDNTEGNYRGGHALCIVGYDDRLRAFKFVNSWGDGWGVLKDNNDPSQGRGYGWISYDFVSPMNPVGFNAWVLVDAENIQDNTLINTPATIEAENFTAQSGALVETCPEGGQDVDMTLNGSWVEYAINNISGSVTNILTYRVATPNAQAQLRLHYNGRVQYVTDVYNTGGWQNYQSFTVPIILSNGIQKIRIIATNGVRLNWLSIQPQGFSSSKSSSSLAVSSAPQYGNSSSSASPFNIPGKVEAEDYSAMNGVQTEACAEGGLNVGWIDTGDWMDYAILVDQAGSYQIDIRLASLAATGALELRVDSQTLLSKNVPNTGGWQTWTTVTGTVNLTQGLKTIKIYASGPGFNMNWINFIKLSSSSTTSLSSSKSSSLSYSSSSSVSSKSSSISSATSSVSSGTGPIQILSYNGSLIAVQNQIYTRFKLVNSGAGNLDLSTVKIRYYFTAEGLQPVTYYNDYSTINSANFTGKVSKLSVSKTGADSYLEIAFNATAGVLAPGAHIEIQGRLAKSDWSNFNQADDYSYNPVNVSYTDWIKVTAYTSGVLRYGIEP